MTIKIFIFIQNAMDTLKAGINEYNTKVISMYDKDGDIIFDKILK
ncbi:hypothetical protein [Clostridium sp. YIM B02555]|nr:hypothetical protein [Clostridium sp. YIM B02555]